MNNKRSDVALKEFVDERGWQQLTYDYHPIADAMHPWRAAISLIVPNHGQLTGHGAGANKKEAKPAAAADLLQQLAGLEVLPPAAWADPTAATTSFKNVLQERLLSPSSNRGPNAVYSEPKRDPNSPDHTPLWTASVTLVDSSTGAQQLAAVGSGSGKKEAHQAAARALMEKQEFEALLKKYLSTSTAHALAVFGVNSDSWPASGATTAAAASAAPSTNCKNQLQDLLAKAAGKGLPGWQQLPQYSSIASGLDHMRVFRTTVTVQGPEGVELTATGQAAPRKKCAEQNAAAAMLQLPEILQLR